jgi:hypothetical protein
MPIESTKNQERHMIERDPLKDLRKLLDPKTWPPDYLIVDGELFWFVPSGDPEETRVRRVLRNGRFQ